MTAPSRSCRAPGQSSRANGFSEPVWDLPSRPHASLLGLLCPSPDTLPFSEADGCSWVNPGQTPCDLAQREARVKARNPGICHPQRQKQPFAVVIKKKRNPPVQIHPLQTAPAQDSGPVQVPPGLSGPISWGVTLPLTRRLPSGHFPSPHYFPNPLLATEPSPSISHMGL